ncbi:MAG: hypothetical protein ACJ795_12710 [Ktedonobacteraceae bacterium]
MTTSLAVALAPCGRSCGSRGLGHRPGPLRSPWPLRLLWSGRSFLRLPWPLLAPWPLRLPWSAPSPWPLWLALSPCLRPGTPPTPGLSNGDEPPARPGPLHRLHFLKSALIGVALAAILAPLRPKCIVIPLLDDGYT